MWLLVSVVLGAGIGIIYVNLISIPFLKLITVENYQQTKTFSFRYPGEVNSTGNFIGDTSKLNTGS